VQSKSDCIIKIQYLDHYDKDWDELSYAKDGDAGFDLRAAIPEDLILRPNGRRALIPTGICVEIPFGYEIQIRPRSGLALKRGFTITNSPGSIDYGFRAEIKIIGHMVGEWVDRGLCCSIFRIKPGMRIAQAVVNKLPVVTLETVEAVNIDTDRGLGGFGHTGV